MKQIETQKFAIGEQVTFVIRPETKAQVSDTQYDVDGRILYWVTYIDGDDVIKGGKFYDFELDR